MSGIIKPDKIVWKPVGQFRVDGHRLYIGDSWMMSSCEVDMPITPGVYDIDARIDYYGSDDRVGLLRGRLLGSTPDGEKEAGEFGVDVASAGVIDADALDRWCAADEKAYEAWQEEFCEAGQSDQVGFHPCAAIGSAMLYTSTGFGDGGYKAVTLLEGAKPVGFEARFLDEAGYENTMTAPMSFKDKVKLVLLSPLLFVLFVPIAIFGLLVRWSNKIGPIFPRK